MVKSKLVLYYPCDSYIFIHRLPDGIGAKIKTPQCIPSGSDENAHLLSKSNDYHGFTSICPLSIVLKTSDSWDSGKQTLHLVGDYTTFPLDIVVEDGSILDISVNTLEMDKTTLTEEVKQNKLTVTNHSNEKHKIVISSPSEGTRNIIDIDSNSTVIPKVTIHKGGEYVFPKELASEEKIHIIPNSPITVIPEMVQKVLSLVDEVFNDPSSEPKLDQIPMIRMYENIIRSTQNEQNEVALNWMNEHWNIILRISKDNTLEENKLPVDVMGVIGSFIDFEHI